MIFMEDEEQPMLGAFQAAKEASAVEAEELAYLLGEIEGDADIAAEYGGDTQEPFLGDRNMYSEGGLEPSMDGMGAALGGFGGMEQAQPIGDATVSSDMRDLLAQKAQKRRELSKKYQSEAALAAMK